MIDFLLLVIILSAELAFHSLFTKFKIEINNREDICAQFLIFCFSFSQISV